MHSIHLIPLTSLLHASPNPPLQIRKLRHRIGKDHPGVKSQKVGCDPRSGSPGDQRKGSCKRRRGGGAGGAGNRTYSLVPNLSSVSSPAPSVRTKETRGHLDPLKTHGTKPPTADPQPSFGPGGLTLGCQPQLRQKQALKPCSPVY